ncbi:MAG TPA: glycoside hydrolase domain-containing protein, partial [Candidatus Acidoferrum sp.]|nr:glycoside hydrolase domain-containing protein [Candidatus Acidoferrum sp.]
MSKIKPGLSILSISSIAAVLILFSCGGSTQPTSQEQQAPRAYLGFDLNIFPGKDALPALRKTFSFSGYWLSPPPQGKTNNWLGQRELLRSQGFGFLLLYRGPLSRELKNEAAAAQRGTLDARNAASVAKSEGFPAQAIIFLDVEEGGRLPATYHSYVRAWTAELSRAG